MEIEIRTEVARVRWGDKENQLEVRRKSGGVMVLYFY